LSEFAFETEITAHQHVLLDAAALVGLSANAVESLELHSLRVPQARVRWPSYFCDEAQYVGVLAYLLQNNLPFELEVAPESRRARYKLHPPFDAHTQHLLSQVNPAQAATLAEMQQHTQQVFQRLREAALPTGNAR
jgi:hypothetical protein